MYIYSDPERENDKHSLPDVEVFYIKEYDQTIIINADNDEEVLPPGWYWWYCFPGCLPDSDPYGLFDTEEAAIANMREETQNID